MNEAARSRRPEPRTDDVRDVETRLSEVLERIAEDARRAPEQYARDTVVPDGGE